MKLVEAHGAVCGEIRLDRGAGLFAVSDPLAEACAAAEREQPSNYEQLIP